MRLDENTPKFTPVKKRENKKTGKAVGVNLPRVTWSKNSFRKQPLVWSQVGVKLGKHERISKAGRNEVHKHITENTHIILAAAKV